jgi:peptidyl-prolyl cis-trans isomerase C
LPQYTEFMRYLSVMMSALLLLLLLTTCAGTANVPQTQADSASPVVARVGANEITVRDFVQKMERDIGPAIQGLLAQGQSPEQIAELAGQQNVRQVIFDEMIQEALLVQQARREGVGIDARAVDQSVDLQQSQISWIEPAAVEGDNPFMQIFDQRISSARQQLVFQMIARHTRADMVNVRHILVADEATADEVLAQLDAGTGFAGLAEQYSTDPGSLEIGGELGWTARGDFVPEFEEAAFSAELNTPIKVQSQFGWHVLEVLDREENRAFGSIEALQRSQNGQLYFESSFLPWYEQLRVDAEASGDLEISPGFDPAAVPLPFLN